MSSDDTGSRGTDTCVMRAARACYEKMIHCDPHADDKPWGELTDRERDMYRQMALAVERELRSGETA